MTESSTVDDTPRIVFRLFNTAHTHYLSVPALTISSHVTAKGQPRSDSISLPRLLSTMGIGMLLSVQESKKMPLIELVFTLVVVGLALWLINRFIPMASSIKTILNVVVVVCVGIWVLQVFGLWTGVTSYRLRR